MTMEKFVEKRENNRKDTDSREVTAESEIPEILTSVGRVDKQKRVTHVFVMRETCEPLSCNNLISCRQFTPLNV